MTESWPRAALFDLDGTLIDSVPDIADAVAELLATEGLPRQPDAAVRDMVGRGMPVLVARAFAASGRPLDEAAHRAMVARMLTIYPKHLTGRTVLMPGVGPALDWLESLGSRQAIVTNKPQDFCETILRHLGLWDRFELVLGDQPLGGRLAPKPAPDMLLFALDRLGVATGDAVMIGDSASDIESARAAAVFSVGVRGGYSAVPIGELHPDVVLDDLSDLAAGLSESQSPDPAAV